MKKQLNILYSPSHFVLSDTLGSEFNEVYSLLSNLKYFSKYEVVPRVVTGVNKLTNKNQFNIVEVWPNYKTKPLNTKDSLIYNIRYTFATIKQIYFSDKKFDILHHIRPFNLYTSFNFAIIFNFKKILTIIGPFCAPYNKKKSDPLSMIIQYLNKQTLKRANIVLVNDEKTKSEIESFTSVNNVVVMPVGKDISQYQYTLKNYDKNSYIFLACGHLVKRKNYTFMIESFAAASKLTKKKITLNILGEGEEKDRLVKLTNKLHITDLVHFLGNVPFDEVGKHYKNADYFLHTPKEEAYGNVLVEATGYGLPTISTKTIGGIAVVGGYGGVVINQGNVSAFANGLADLVNDSERSSRLSISARKYAENTFDWRSILIPKLENIYDRIIQK
jgi:glycosyltransferase involved in cell wall biosynthesis